MTWKGIVGKPFTPQEFHDYVLTLGKAPEWVKFVVLHNTAIPRLSEWHKVSGERRMTGLQSYYRDSQKWSAGPHLFVADDLIWCFTPLWEHGVHSPSWNGCAWGVEMVGDFTLEPFATGAGAKVRDNTIQALAVLHDWAKLDSSSLKLHKEDAKTTHDCPGHNVNKADVIARLHNAILTLRGKM